MMVASNATQEIPTPIQIQFNPVCWLPTSDFSPGRSDIRGRRRNPINRSDEIITTTLIATLKTAQVKKTTGVAFVPAPVKYCSGAAEALAVNVTAPMNAVGSIQKL